MVGLLWSWRRGRRVRLAAVASLAVTASFLAVATPAHADTFLYVDKNNPLCTNTGTGTATRPFCSINKAATVATAGQTVLVSSGTYSEQVQPANSGTQSQPIAYRPAPGASVTVTGQIHAFYISRAWITVSGFTVSGTSSYGIYLKTASNVTLSGNHVTTSGLPVSGSVAQGIYVKDTTDSHLIGNITDHNSDTGIYLTTGNSGVEIRGNLSYLNARQYTRAATGIDVRSPDNTVIGNIVHDNEDSGIQLYNGAHRTLVADNLSYNNGDHCIDVLNSTNTVVVGNTAYNCVTAGINFEGQSSSTASSGATIANNISVDSGLTSTSTKGAIRVDSASIPGTTLDYDLMWLRSAGTMVTWGAKLYTSLASFTSATGFETHGFQAQPGWVSAANGDFHLTAGSAAIDSATSLVAGEQTTDLEGTPRIDDPASPNIGVGPRTYDDRGAFEYRPDLPPVAALTVSPTSGTAPMEVTADASGSTDVDATPISTYTFNFGDGSAATGPQAGATATHTYSSGGTFTVTVTVTDTAGKSATASRSVQIAASDNPPAAALSVSPSNGTAPLTVNADASASTDTDATPVSTYTFDFGDGTGLVGPQASATTQHVYAIAGAYTATVTVADTAGLSGTATSTVTVGVPDVDEVHYTWLDSTTVAFDWRGGPNTVSYGVTTVYGNSVVGTTPNPLPYSSPGPFWEATIAGLQPGTTYHYSIGGSPDHTFSTTPTGNFRFDLEADIGDSVTYPDVGTTQSQIGSDAPDMVLVPGDLTYGEAHGQQAVDQHFNDVMAWSRSVPYMAAWGNHEWEATGDDLRNYKGRFAIPNAYTSPGAPSLGCCGEDWGWFDVAGVRFVAYPEPYTSATWTDWAAKADSILAAAQADPTIRYIITFGHRPAYSTGAYPGSAALASILNGLGDKYSKYVLNLNGHSHDYERFIPIHGVTHVTAGGGGASLELPWTSTDPRTALRAFHLAHLRVDVTATAMTLAAICGPPTSNDDTTCDAGSVLDQVVIPAPPSSDSAPVAALSLSPTSGPAPLLVTADASASTDTDSTPIATYAFNFGDGTVTGTQASPTASHTYSAAGTYTVAVTVTDTVGRPSTTNATVTVTQPVADSPPTASLTVTPTSGAPPLLVTADASASTDPDSTPIMSYTFNFGDGTVIGPQSGATASHSYGTVGNRTVTVTVTDTAGLTATASAQVSVAIPDAPPVASLTLSPTGGTAPLTLTADASGSTDTDSTPIATYKFSFGDGTTVGPQAGATASHTYAGAGTYTVPVTVTDTAGKFSSTTASVTVASANTPPVAALTVTPSSGPAPLAVTADASASYDPDGAPIASYRFAFGDGTVVGPQAGTTATHTYTAAGIYTATVTVTDVGGLSGSASTQVSVQVASGTNFVGNPGFETDTSGWNNNGRTGITLTRVASGHSGGWAAQLANTTSTAQADCTLNDSPNWIKTTQAGTYTASLWVRADTAGAVLKLRLREYNGSTFVNSSAAQVTLSTAWQQIKVTYAPQVVGSTLDYTAYLSNAVPGACFTADDASITVG